MFDLEQSIREWREQMLAAGIKTPVPLEELESHLREDIERQRKLGMDVRQAFETAVQKMGDAIPIKREFQKVGTLHMNTMRIMAIIMSLFGTVLGGGLILPALGQWHEGGVLHFWPLLAGSLVEIVAICVLICVVRMYRATRGRTLISIVLVAAGSFYATPVIQAFFIRKADLTEWIFCAALAVTSIVVYGSCWYRIWNFPALPISESREQN